MTMFRQALTAAAPLALALALAACGQPAADGVAPAAEPAAAPAEAPIPASKVEDKPAIALAPDGLRLVASSGSARGLDFGLGKAEVVEILTQAHGVSGKASSNSECGAGPIDFVAWPDGLSALFQDDKFVGWSLGHDAAKTLTTMNGVGLGSTRSQLAEAFGGLKVEETTLGHEFDAGGIYGILSGPGANATVDAMWAGTSCVFR